jgi:hypothetical protein
LCVASDGPLQKRGNSLRQQGTLRFLLPVFACGRKTGNDRIGASTLPKAKHHLEAITAMATP